MSMYIIFYLNCKLPLSALSLSIIVILIVIVLYFQSLNVHTIAQIGIEGSFCNLQNRNSRGIETKAISGIFNLYLFFLLLLPLVERRLGIVPLLGLLTKWSRINQMPVMIPGEVINKWWLLFIQYCFIYWDVLVLQILWLHFWAPFNIDKACCSSWQEGFLSYLWDTWER